MTKRRYTGISYGRCRLIITMPAPRAGAGGVSSYTLRPWASRSPRRSRSRVTLADGHFEFCVQLRDLALRRGRSAILEKSDNWLEVAPPTREVVSYCTSGPRSLRAKTLRNIREDLFTVNELHLVRKSSLPLRGAQDHPDPRVTRPWNAGNLLFRVIGWR